MHTTNVPPVFDGQSATTMDEALLRDEPMLGQYWSAVGWLSYAKCKLAVSDIKSSLQARQLLLMNHMSTVQHKLLKLQLCGHQGHCVSCCLSRV